jgi:hypothetical protein
MTAAKTLEELRSAVRALADQATIGAALPFVRDAELDERINEALAELYDLLIQHRGHGYYHAERSFSTASGQTQYPLPDDFYQLLSVRITDGTAWHQPDVWQMQDLATLSALQLAGGSGLGRYFYRLQAGALSIRPAPVDTITVHLDYIPAFPGLKGPKERFDGVNGWEKWACLTAAAELALKEENLELASSLQARRSDVEQKIRALAGSRDAARPPRIQDTRRDWWGRRYGRRGEC